jgi:hypothetical protein
MNLWVGANNSGHSKLFSGRNIGVLEWVDVDVFWLSKESI